jgi:hypothetical protein
MSGVPLDPISDVSVVLGTGIQHLMSQTAVMNLMALPFIHCSEGILSGNSKKVPCSFARMICHVV